MTFLDEAREATRPDPVVEYYMRYLDRTLIRENLKRSVEERVLNLMELNRFLAELRRAGREAAERS